MPIMFVNPAPKARKSGARRVKPARGAKIITRTRASSARLKPSTLRLKANVAKFKKKRALVKAKVMSKTTAKPAVKKVSSALSRKNKRKGKTMAKKLYGAAAKAHAKRLAKMHKSKKRKKAGRKAKYRRKAKRAAMRRNPPIPKKRKKRKAAKARKARKSYKAMKRRARSRKASSGSSRRRRSYENKSYGVKSLKRARRSIKRARRKGGRAGYYAKRHHMMTNPRRRRRRKYRRNPSMSSITSMPEMLMAGLKQAVPVAASLYLTRFIVAKIGPQIPMIDKVPAQFQGPVVSSLMVVAANFATKKGPLAKYRAGIMLGTSLNLVDSIVKAFAPDNIKGMFGLGDSGIYDEALGEYTGINDYLQVGNDVEPIDDDIALSDYVEVNGIEEELGGVQEELGVSEELGNAQLGPRNLGGVSQSSMLKALKDVSSVGVVPQRSFVKQVPDAGAGYDNPGVLYTGIFAGGM